jgi:hypothetical protein
MNIRYRVTLTAEERPRSAPRLVEEPGALTRSFEHPMSEGFCKCEMVRSSARIWLPEGRKPARTIIGRLEYIEDGRIHMIYS